MTLNSRTKFTQNLKHIVTPSLISSWNQCLNIIWTCACGGFGSNASSIWVLVSCGLALKDSIPSTSRWSWGSWAPWPERGEFPMRFVGTGGAKVSEDPVKERRRGLRWSSNYPVYPVKGTSSWRRGTSATKRTSSWRRGASATKRTSSGRRQNFVSSLIRCCDEVWTSSWLSKDGTKTKLRLGSKQVRRRLRT